MKKLLISNGLEIAPIALGAMNFGTTTPREAAYRVLDAYMDMGGNFIDTSNNYAHWAGTGDESETLLGQWLRDRGCRDRVVLATKVGFDRHGEGAGLKAAQIEYWIDESLRKLGTDYVDLYYAHTDDTDTPIEETMEAFDRLVKKGKVLHLGGSNYDTWRFAEANAIAAAKGQTPYTVMQQKFTYLHPRADMAPKYIFNETVSRERLRYLVDKDIPLVAYSCLAKGGYEIDERIPADYIVGDRLVTVRAMAKEKGVNTSALVVAWMVNLHRCEGFPRVIPLFASSRVEHFLDNLKGVELTLSDEDMRRLNRA
ncbi:MAG: aldo/keto reductase [Ruminococcaceae bacterium]|nr:aldo/keto reductase [Oscillospiraceae bacterium]